MSLLYWQTWGERCAIIVKKFNQLWKCKKKLRKYNKNLIKILLLNWIKYEKYEKNEKNTKKIMKKNENSIKFQLIEINDN